MANREMERYTTSAYTTQEGVRVTEEHLRFPLRRDLPDRPLEPKDVCEFELVTFEKTGRSPVFWVRESAGNQCEDRKLLRCVDATVMVELNDRRRDLTPEDVTMFVESKNQTMNQVAYFSPPLGEGKCNREDELLGASLKSVDVACKSNLGCKENLATAHLQTQSFDLSKEAMSNQSKQQAEGQSPNRVRLLAKLEALNQEAEAPKAKEPEQKAEQPEQEQEQEKSKKR